MKVVISSEKGSNPTVVVEDVTPEGAAIGYKKVMDALYPAVQVNKAGIEAIIKKEVKKND